MKRYSVQTGWKGKDYNVPEEKGNISVLAKNKKVANLCVLVAYIGLSEIVGEISAVGDPNLTSIPTNLLCGSKLLIAN